MKVGDVATDPDLIKQLDEGFTNDSNSSVNQVALSQNYKVGDVATDPALIKQLESGLPLSSQSQTSPSKNFLGFPTIPTQGGGIHIQPTDQAKAQLSDLFSAHPIAQTQAFLHGLKNSGLTAENYITSGLDKLLGTNFNDATQQKIQDFVNDPHYQQLLKQYPTQALIGNLMGQATPIAAASASLHVANAPFLAKLLGTGTAGALTSQNPAEGATLGLTAEALNKFLPNPVQAVSNAYSKANESSLVQKVNNMVSFGDSPEESATHSLVNDVIPNFIKASNNERNTWGGVKTKGMILDMTPGQFTIDTSPYKSALSSHASDILDRESQSPSLENEAAFNLVHGWNNAPLSTFTDLINHGQALNSAYRATMIPGVQTPFSTTKYAISQFNPMMENILEKNGLTDFLGKDLNNAKNATKYLNKTFTQVVSPDNEEMPSTLPNFINNPASGNAANWIKPYVPTSPQDGTANIQRLGDIVGSPDKARNLILHQLFGNIEDNGDFLQVFNGLSKDQRQALFNPDQLNLINKMKSSRLKNNIPMGGRIPMQQRPEQLGVTQTTKNVLNQTLSRLLLQSASQWVQNQG